MNYYNSFGSICAVNG